jgi:hypothetical protein
VKGAMDTLRTPKRLGLARIVCIRRTHGGILDLLRLRSVVPSPVFRVRLCAYDPALRQPKV